MYHGTLFTTSPGAVPAGAPGACWSGPPATPGRVLEGGAAVTRSWSPGPGRGGSYLVPPSCSNARRSSSPGSGGARASASMSPPGLVAAGVPGACWSDPPATPGQVLEGGAFVTRSWSPGPGRKVPYAAPPSPLKPWLNDARGGLARCGRRQGLVHTVQIPMPRPQVPGLGQNHHKSAVNQGPTP